MPPRVIVACNTPVAEGMVVDTEAEGAAGARGACLEFLLKNHPLDCPICDKAGECDLQDYAFRDGTARAALARAAPRAREAHRLGDR